MNLEDQNPQIRNSMNFKPKPFNPDRYDYLSKTIPDQSMTMRQILERFGRGLPIMGVAKLPIYEGENSLGFDPRRLDLTEAAELAENAKEAITAFEKTEKDSKSKKEREALKSALKLEIEAELSAQGTPPPPNG